MRKIFGLASMLSLLTTPVLGAGGFSYSKNNQMSPDPRERSNNSFNLVKEPSACKISSAPLNFFSRRSQSVLVNLFENVACSGVGIFVGNENIDSNYCAAVYKCEDFQGDKAFLIEEDKVFLETEALDLLIRENTLHEMNKYNSDKSYGIKRLLSFIEKLPPKVQAKIGKCESLTYSNINSCTGESDQSKLIQQYITNSVNKKNASRATALIPGSTLLAETIEGNSDTASKKDDAKVLAVGAKIYQGGNSDRRNFSDVFTNLKDQEKTTSDDVNVFSSQLNPQEDTTVNALLEAFKNNSEGKKISASEIKEIVKKTLLAKDGNDFIFNYKNKKREAIIEKAVREINFSSNDFDGSSEKGRKYLFDKINDIRVRLVESHFREDCNKVSTSIEMVCTNLTNKLETGASLDLVLANGKDPFQKMIDFYIDSDLATKNEKIQKLEIMKNSNSQVYQKYLMYALQINICGSKFPKVEDTSSTRSKRRSQRSQIIADKISEYEKVSEESRASAIAAISDTVKNNDSFKQEMKSLGIKIEAPKSEMMPVDVASNIAAKSDNGVAPAKSDSFMTDPKNFFGGDNSNQNTKTSKAYEPSFTEASQRFNTGRDSVNDKEAGDYEKNLRAKLAELESREKSISRKVSQASADDVAGSTQTSELADLRRQIEELKKTQTAELGAKAMSAETISSDRSTKSPFSKQGPSVFGSKSGSSEQGERQEAPAASIAQASKAGSSSDFSPQNASDTSARTPAAIGSSAGASKSKVEKTGLGIVLSKSGDVFQDPANILENPKEVEIARLLEATNGQPFLIRENGVLMKVSMELDSNGKPQLSKGKPRFKKERLSKSQQETIARDTNIQKTLKEVGRDPTRLFNLKSLIKNTVKRE